jgi:hypothetical protein
LVVSGVIDTTGPAQGHQIPLCDFRAFSLANFWASRSCCSCFLITRSILNPRKLKTRPAPVPAISNVRLSLISEEPWAWHPTPLTLAFGLEDRPTPSREDVRGLKRRNDATFADSEGGCPRLSIISLLHPQTADRREAPALAAVVSQINPGRPHARLWSCLRTLSVFLAEKRVNGVAWHPETSRIGVVVRPPWNAMFGFQFLRAKSHIAAVNSAWMVQ